MLLAESCGHVFGIVTVIHPELEEEHASRCRVDFDRYHLTKEKPSESVDFTCGERGSGWMLPNRLQHAKNCMTFQRIFKYQKSVLLVTPLERVGNLEYGTNPE